MVILGQSESDTPADASLRPFRILAIAGGGARGVIPAVILDALERDLPVREAFDLVAGTSTGGLLALRAASPKTVKGGGDAPSFASFYVNFADRVFQRRKSQGVWGIPLHPYSTSALESILESQLGVEPLSNASVHLVIPTYDLVQRAPFVLTSWGSLDRSGITFAKAGLAASAAPQFFPPVKVNAGRGERWLVDGGLFANNPSLVAVAEARRSGVVAQGQPIDVVSLGTGEFSGGVASTAGAGSAFSAKFWGPNLLPVVLDATADAVEMYASAVSDQIRYFPINPPMPKRFDRLDNASDVHQMKQQTESWIATGEGQALLAGVGAVLSGT